MLADSADTLPVDIQYLPDIYRKKAEVELKETPEKRIKGLQFLKERAKEDKHLRDIDFEDDFLQQFLRYSKYNLERACTQLRNHVNYRRRFPAMFGNVSQEVLDNPIAKFCTVLPKRCPDGCTILLFELGKWDPDNFDNDDFSRLIVTLYYQSLRHPLAQINGFKAIHDFTGTAGKHLMQSTPRNLYHLHYGGVNSFPTRFKELHMVTKSVTMTMVWSVLRLILSEKIRNRVIFHSNPEGLLNHFPRTVLPSQYGGDLKNYYMGDWITEANEQEGKSAIGGQRNVA